MAPFQWLKWSFKKDRDRLLNRVFNYRTSGHAFNLMGRFKLGMMKKCFTVRVVKQWYRLSRKVVDAPVLEAFKVTLDRLCAICSS